jgi:hypothetical protein
VRQASRLFAADDLDARLNGPRLRTVTDDPFNDLTLGAVLRHRKRRHDETATGDPGTDLASGRHDDSSFVLRDERPAAPMATA